MRLAAVFFGFFLTLAAAIMAAQMMKSGEPFDPIAPCLLGGFGFSTLLSTRAKLRLVGGGTAR